MFKNQHGIRERIKAVGFETCAVSELTVAELYVGAFKGKRPEHFKEVEFVINHFNILPDSCAIESYARIRAELELSGTRIDDIDCLIGCTALVNRLTMVTHNRKHFDRIQELQIEDWEN